LPEILQSINWIDIVFVILLLGMVYKGTRTGVGGQILSLCGMFVLIFLSIRYYKIISEALFGFLLQDWARPVSFFVIAALVFVAVKFLERVFNVLNAEELASIEKIGGAIIAGCRALMLFGAIGILLLLIPINYIQESAAEGSWSCMFFVKADVRIYDWISKVSGLEKEDQTDEILTQILTKHSKES